MKYVCSCHPFIRISISKRRDEPDCAILKFLSFVVCVNTFWIWTKEYGGMTLYELSHLMICTSKVKLSYEIDMIYSIDL